MNATVAQKRAFATMLGVKPEEITDVTPIAYRVEVTTGTSPRTTEYHTIEVR